MKKIILASIILIGLYSCKKESSSNTPSSWISGKWKREDLIDTIYSGKTIAGINNFNVSLNPNELNFSSASTGTSTIPSYGSFTFSLSNNTLVYSNGVTWSIVQISSTRFKLLMHENQYGIGWYDQYIKE